MSPSGAAAEGVAGKATAGAAPSALERGGPRPTGPRCEASARFGGWDGAPAGVRRPPYRLADGDLGIPKEWEVLFLGVKRPVRARVRVDTAGKPLEEAWKDRIRRLFEFFDRDDDGGLNATEMEFVYSADGLERLLAGGTYYRAAVEPVPLDEIDRDDDGKVSFDELAAYYAPAAANLVRASAAVTADLFTERLSGEMIRLLDRDGDGRLVREELGGLEGLLNRHDLDEDECLTALELVPGLTSPPPPPAAGMMAPAAQPRAAREDPDLFVGPAGKLPAKVTERVMRAYDADKNLRLSPAEFAVGRATFDRLDRNGDGELTATELDRWREQPPDLEVSVALGNASQTEVTCRLPDGEREAPHPVRAVEATGRVTLLAGGQGVELNAVPGRGGNRPVRPAMDLQGLFNAAAGKDGFVRDTDLVGPQSQFLRIIFDGADRDADGRLTGPEFDAYFAVQQGFHDLPLVLRHMTRRPSLFQLLDGNDDGRLGVRELRAAWDRLRALEPEPGKGFGPEDLRAQGQIDIGTMGRVQQTAPRDVLAVRPRRAPAKGPTWFRKMDRNGDGDVSPSEWLGRPEHFARIDADADALISLAEAEAVSGAAARAEAAPPAAPRPPPAPPR